MAEGSRRRNALIVLVLVLIAIILLLTRCLPKKPVGNASGSTPVSPALAPTGQPRPEAAAPNPVEALTPATLTAPERIVAGSAFSVTWVGPNNPGDYVTIVKPD